MQFAKIWSKYKQRASRSKREKNKDFRETTIILLMSLTKTETKKLRSPKKQKLQNDIEIPYLIAAWFF